MTRYTSWTLIGIFAAIPLGASCATPQGNVVRYSGAQLSFGSDVTDEDLLSLTPDPNITSIGFDEGQNRWQSRLTPAGIEALSRWTSLQVLSLPDGAVTDDALLKLSTLTQLRYLGLVNMRQESRLTAKGLGVLASFPHLRELRLDGQRLTDDATVPIGKLTELRKLSFYRASLTDAGIANLADLTLLEELNIGESQVTDNGLKVIGKMTHLKSLDLRAPVTGKGLSALRGLRDLAWLTLGPSVNDDAMETLSTLKNLESLYLEKAQITDAHLDLLAGLTRLQMLDLNGTGVTDKGVKTLLALPSLKWLRLANTQVSDGTLDQLASGAALPLLTNLDLEDTAVTPEAVARLQRARPALTPQLPNNTLQLSNNMRALAWLSEAPTDLTATGFSFEEWANRGRKAYWVEETLGPMLAQPDQRAVRAAFALGWIGTKGKKSTIYELARAALRNTNLQVRTEALAALERLGDESAFETFRQASVNRNRNADDRAARLNSFIAMGRLGGAAAEALLLEATRDTDSAIADSAGEGLRLWRQRQ